MCGLVGMAGDTSSNWKDVFDSLLIVDSLRGAHSTGVAAVKRFQNEIGLVKQPGGPHGLMVMPEYRNAMNSPLKAIIGHNRYATLGKHTVENAHPFAFPTLVGAHNGTLDKRAIEKLHGNELFDTDSEAIYCNINQHGLRDTVDKLQGAWALTWFDVKTNTINMLRNDKRPLWYAYSKDRCTLIWASEPDMIDFVTKRAKNPLYEDSIYSVDTDQHHVWVIPDSINKKFEPPIKSEMKAPPPPAVVWHYHAGGGHNRGYKWNQQTGVYEKEGGDATGNVLPFPKAGKHTRTGGTRNTDLTSAFRIKKDTAKFRPPYKDHSTGKIINKKEFNRITADGCAFCGNNDVDWGEFIHPLRTMEGHQSFICEDCYNDDDVFETCQSLL